MKLSNNSNRTIYYFDVCGTLYNANTTYAFLLYYFKQFNKRKYLLFRMHFSIGAKLLWKILASFGLKRKIRTYLISFIKGESVIDVKREAKNFLKDELCNKEIAFTISELSRIKNKQGSNIYLVSASIEPVVAAIDENFKTDGYIATSLESKSGFYTGKIKEEMEGAKKSKLLTKGWMLENSIQTLYTDGVEDVELVKSVDMSYILVNEKSKKNWLKLNLDRTKLTFIDRKGK